MQPLKFFFYHNCFFCHFNYCVPWCGLPWVHLVWCSLGLLDLGVCFFPQVREVVRYYCFKWVLWNLSVFSLWDPYNVNISMIDAVLEFLNLFLWFFFSLQLGCFPLSCLPDCWFILLHFLIHYSFPVGYFSLQLLCSSTLIGSFFLNFFLSLCWSSHWVYPAFLQFSEHL